MGDDHAPGVGAGAADGPAPGYRPLSPEAIAAINKASAEAREASRAWRERPLAEIDADYAKAIAEEIDLPPGPGEFHDGLPLTPAAERWYRQELAQIRARNELRAPMPVQPADDGLTAGEQSALGDLFTADSVGTLVHSIFEALVTARQAKWLQSLAAGSSDSHRKQLAQQARDEEQRATQAANGFLRQLAVLDPAAYAELQFRLEDFRNDDPPGTAKARADREAQRAADKTAEKAQADEAAALETGHYDDGHSFGFGTAAAATAGGWDRLSPTTEQLDEALEQARPIGDDDGPGGPPAESTTSPTSAATPPGGEGGGSRKGILVGAGLIAAAGLVLIAVILADSGGSSTTTAADAHSTTTSGIGSTSSTEGSAPTRATVVPTTVNNVLITYNAAFTDAQDPGNPCHVVDHWTYHLNNGPTFAGQTAVVVLYGLDYLDHPTRSFTVAPDGSFSFDVETTKCYDPAMGTKNQGGTLLESVGGDSNVSPPPSAILPS